MLSIGSGQRVVLASAIATLDEMLLMVQGEGEGEGGEEQEQEEHC